MSTPSKDREELQQDAERYATQLPYCSSRDEALEVAIKAAETAFAALKLVKDPEEKQQFTVRARELMQKAETIKKSDDWKSIISKSVPLQGEATFDPSKIKLLREPANSRPLPTKEQIIVLKAGFLNGEKFPEWKGPPSPSEFELKDGEGLFLDEASELPLSDFQFEVLDDWKRPVDALPPPSWFPGDRTNLGPSMDFVRDIDLVQDAATDCSVVASLCAGVARGKRGHPKMMQSFLYPYDASSGKPRLSKNGRYVVRMNFNGAFRKVVIDDRLPTSSIDRVIHVVDRNNPGLVWPALLEKAYLKVRGGYDFPGSNSGTDLWILTGWIPEQVFLQADDLEPERFWKRIVSGFTYGDILVTLGTGKMSSKTERAVGLAGEHDYAVLDLKEIDGQRLMLIKNPWIEGTSWRGRFKSAPRSKSQASSHGDTSLIELDDEVEPVESPRDLLNVDEQLTPGTFWMDLDNVLQHFESIYLNWNTGLFAHRQDIHFAWDLSEPADGGPATPRGPYASLQYNPQITITARKGGEIWLLLCRHFHNTVPAHATAEEIESGRHFIDLNGHISLIAFAANGKQVMLSERYLQKGWFVDSPQTLLKLADCEPDKVYTIVPLEQELPASRHTFTISAFSSSQIVLSEAKPRYACKSRVLGNWTKDSAGGNAQTPTYCDNPQYSLLVSHKTSISLLLEVCDPRLNVHVKLLHSNGQRLYRVRSRDIIVDSKDYRPGCCLAEMADLDPGQYTVICSTFEPQQLGDFSLAVEADQPIQARLLPREGAGRIRTELSTASFKPGESRLAAPIAVRRLVNFYANARHIDPARSPSASHSQIRLSVELGTGMDRHFFVASEDGGYADAAGGVRTKPIDLSPQELNKYQKTGCWIVLDRTFVSSGVQEEKFQVELFSDQPNAIECGAWRARDD